LSDLTTNDWMGKADATSRGLLDSIHVRAMICTNVCSNTVSASTPYNFAVSGDAAKGGASFTATSSALGPNNNNAWSGATYFDGAKEYWVNMIEAWPHQWGNGSAGGNHCSSWTSNSSGISGNKGISTSTTGGRWWGTTTTCDQTRRLICLVNP
jgi:hypothetical protein